MSDSEREAWDERYRSGSYRPRPAAGSFLERWIPTFPPGRALDVACGAGRNALRLAEAGHRVEAVDVSAVAVEMAQAEADRRGLAVAWTVADLDGYNIPDGEYDLITVIRYVNRDLWPRLITGLAPTGWLLVEHHVRTSVDVAGPSAPDFRLEPQELLEAFSALRIVFYEEVLEPADEEGRRFALARLVACKGNPGF